MPRWDPSQYRRFERERSQPARDLLARVPLEAAARVMDLGCGPGNSTEALAQRFSAAALHGLDSSAPMIEAARARLPGATFAVGDAGAFARDADQRGDWDLIFSNAALHWLDDHVRLFPALLGCLRPGGCLAVQMPDNFQAPTHACARHVALRGAWANRLAEVAERLPVAEPAAYFDLLAPAASDVQLWHTEYFHAFDDAEAVVQWTLGSALRPYLERLDAAERETFLAAYREGIAAAYPARPSGGVLMGFRRLFLVATVGC